MGGRSLSQFFGATVATAGRLVLADVVQQADGEISGVASDAEGQPLAGGRVDLTRPPEEGQGRLVARTDAAGTFSFAGLGSGRYEVRLLVGGQEVATSGAINLVEGTMQVSGVALAQAVETNGGLSLGAAMAIGAGIGLGVVVFLAFATAGVPP